MAAIARKLKVVSKTPAAANGRFRKVILRLWDACRLELEWSAPLIYSGRIRPLLPLTFGALALFFGGVSLVNER
jgi:hypothetical protein